MRVAPSLVLRMLTARLDASAASGQPAKAMTSAGCFRSSCSSRISSLIVVARFYPAPMRADQLDQPGVGFGFRHTALHAFLADVEIDMAGAAAHVAEIGIGHLARPVHHAAHDRDLHAPEMGSTGLDPLGGALEIEQRPPA